MECPAQQPGREHERERLLGVVVDEHASLREADVPDQGETSLRASLLVPVGRVDEHRQVEAEGELELGREVLLLLRRLVVEPDLPDRHDAVLGEVARQELDHARRDAPVVRFLRVQGQRAEVVHAELARPEPLPAEQPVEVVLEGADVGARLPEPEGGLDDGGDAGLRHRLVVDGRPRGHVDVRIEELHGRLPFSPRM